MMKLAFDDVSSVTGQNNSICIFTQYTEPVVLSGLILTLIGLVLGLIIIFIKKLHSSSTMNTIFIVITYIVLGVAWICWSCAMLIVIIFTTYHLDIHREQEQLSEIFIMFVLFYEYFVLNYTLQFSLNSFFDCKQSSNKNLTRIIDPVPLNVLISLRIFI
ncbi:hypothetical protein MS3_00008274 [Schistosoma haematobium]|uniref:Uncharacterized protein n=1 Tax=Schistosoma haematobium TaxID=6185 RepID=A0A922IJH7_SCHHA|nr:hypothetical protein MS3_00008274 [Schistosoma haematobium]KAH9581010.1 hypothetical protein MS3_00008274 [Schistosoma haematobium]